MNDIPLRELSVNARAPRRSSILTLHLEGMKNSEIAKRAQCSPRTVQRALKRYDELGDFGDRPRSGRPPKHDERDKRELARLVTSQRSLKAVDATAKYNAVRNRNKHLSASTVKNDLADADLGAHVKQWKPPLKPQQRRGRLAWARNMQERMEKGEIDWRFVVFTDESKFTIQG